MGLEVLEEMSNEDMSPQIRRKRALMMKCTSSPTMKSIVDNATSPLKASALKLHEIDGIYITDQLSPRRELFTISPKPI